MAEQPGGASPREGRSCLGVCLPGCVGLLVLLAAVFFLLYSSSGRYHPVVPPPPPLPVPNALDAYRDAAAMLKATGGTSAIYAARPLPTGAALLAAQRGVVAKNQPALKRLREGLAWECRVPAARSMNDLFPYLAEIRELARLLNAEEAVLAAKGDHAGAFASGLDGIEMGQDIVHGGVLIHGLVNVAVQVILHPSMPEQIEHLSAADCDRIAKRMERVLLSRVSAATIFKEECDFIMVAMPESLDRYGTLLASSVPGPSGGNPLESLKVAVGRIHWRLRRDVTLPQMDEHFAALQREASKPAAQRRPIPEPTDMLTQMFVPVFSGATSKFDLTDARNRMILCALALRGYRLKHGRLPASLNELGLDSSLLADPFSGKMLVYKPRGDDYLLYSVGPDLRDDGGVPLDERQPNGSGDLGVRQFGTFQTLGRRDPSQFYRRVPHMLPPKLPPGAPPLGR